MPKLLHKHFLKLTSCQLADPINSHLDFQFPVTFTAESFAPKVKNKSLLGLQEFQVSFASIFLALLGLCCLVMPTMFFDLRSPSFSPLTSV